MKLNRRNQTIARLGFIRRLGVALACVCLASAVADSKPKTAPAANTNKKTSSTLSDAINQLLASAPLKGADLGVHVLRLSDRKTLCARDTDRLLLPASNAKLFTTAAAWTVLGPAYEFRTLVGTCGRDLVVVGGGDPTIGARFTDGDPTVYFRRWARVLKDQRLTEISGDLVVDDSFLDRQFVHPNWPKRDVGHWYAAPVAALALNDNCIDVRVAPGPTLDSPAIISLIPNTHGFQISNRTRTVSSSKDHAPRVARAPGSNIILCEGGVYQRAQPITNWVTVDDPVQYFATVLREVLAEEGVKIAGTIRKAPGLGRSDDFHPRVVHRFKLLPALAVTNKESQNLYAEQILKTLGAEHGDGTWSGGRRVASKALDQLGLDPASYAIDDGCGLSRSNRASARAFTTLLAAMDGKPHGDLFRETLSVAGVDGTLKNRLAENPYRGRIWAKTGSISGVRAISGYVQTRSRDWLVFSLLINNARYSVRDVQDKFCRLLADWDE